MKVVADLHLHSKYSRAVSKQMELVQMAKWAGIKGIDLLGTGDFTHPQWLIEIKNSLEEYSQGVFRLVQSSKCKVQSYSSKFKVNEVKFLLTAEISSIYSQGGKCRRIHNIIIAPSISSVEKINDELKKRGCNLSSDGRPIIGLSAMNLAELVLSIEKDCLIIPAHIWTPWFSLYGEKSGFDTIEECFGEYSKYIYAVETGLSSDPAMNWQVADLDKRSLVSFSDAHSLGKLGREATVLEINSLSYEEVVGALRGDKKNKGNEGIKYTIEFYPEEGKYHYSGHRNCGIVWTPEESQKKGGICPVCGKKLTIGVTERVRDLGDMRPSFALPDKRVSAGKDFREEEYDKLGVRWINKEGRPSFVRLVPLVEIIAESYSCGISAKRVKNEYEKLTSSLGSEIEILMVREIGKIREIGGERLAEGIMKVRKGDIFIDPGYDGVFGVVKVWPSSRIVLNSC